MKINIPYFLIFLYAILLTQCICAQQKVKVHISYTNSYCGGARPTPQIEAAYNSPRDLSDFYVLLESKKTIKIKTDSTGNFRQTLKAGTYKIYLGTKINQQLNINYNPGCSKMLQTPYGKLVIAKGKTDYEINLHFPCNPCEPNNKP